MILRFALLFAVVVMSISGCESARNFGKRHVKIASLAYVEREDNLLIDDRYWLRVVVFHEEPNSVKGRYIVRAFGDVFGGGGQANTNLGDNYDETSDAALEPGLASATRLIYYINNPAVMRNNLDPDVVKKSVNMRIEIEFIPLSGEPTYKRTAATLEYVRGVATIAVHD